MDEERNAPNILGRRTPPITSRDLHWRSKILFKRRANSHPPPSKLSGAKLWKTQGNAFDRKEARYDRLQASNIGAKLPLCRNESTKKILLLDYPNESAQRRSAGMAATWQSEKLLG